MVKHIIYNNISHTVISLFSTGMYNIKLYECVKGVNSDMVEYIIIASHCHTHMRSGPPPGRGRTHSPKNEYNINNDRKRK